MTDTGSLLRQLVELGGGDLHISPGRPPWVRTGGKLRALEEAPAAPKDVGELLLKTAPPERRDEFKRTGSVSFAAEYGDIGRFRVHVFRERLGSAATVRLVPGEVASFEGLGLPEVTRDFCSRRGGLVVVAGTAGSGKTTTLAAMVDFINHERACHVLTIENPIEFVHEPRRGLVHQREPGTHCGSFPETLRSGFRDGADVILLGDVPDAETVEAALEAAASGSLVLAEMRARNAVHAVARLLGLFPAGRQAYARAALGSSLSGVIVQRLLPRADGEGLVAAFEVLISTPAVASAIREDGACNIASAIRSGARAGTMLLDDAILKLVSSGTVRITDAPAFASDEEELKRKCEAAGVSSADAAAPAATAADEQADDSPATRPLVTRRLSRTEMFLDPVAAERRTRSQLARRSRTAAFSDAKVPSPKGDDASQLDIESPSESADPRIVAGREILVVDDDAEIRELLVRMLQGAGARVKAVAEPSRALAEIESGSYDLAMFDILMPDVSGMELYDQAVIVAPALRERVLFVTGCNPDGRLNDRIAARGGRLLRKPFVAEDLLKAAASTLSAERRAP
jgi:twitching motility protein PilT